MQPAGTGRLSGFNGENEMIPQRTELTFGQLRQMYGCTDAKWMHHQAQVKDQADKAGSERPVDSGAGETGRNFSFVEMLISGQFLQPGIHEWFYDMTAMTDTESAASAEDRETRRDIHKHIPFFAPLTLLTWLAGRLSVRSGRRNIFWIGTACRPSIYVLAAGLGMSDWQDRCIFIEPADDDQQFWAMDQVLRCTATAAVVADASACSMATSRRLQLAAQAGNGYGFFVRPLRALAEPSLAATRWLVQPHPTDTQDPHWRVSLRRAKPAIAGIAVGTACIIRWRYDMKTGSGQLIPGGEPAGA